jgi:hypothetical protein
VLGRVFGTRFSGIWTRAYDIGPLLDTVIICAAGTILLIRSELWLTNYPQLGGHGLHIAHLLWGGAGMLVAIVLLVSFISPVVRRVGAILGGIGLGFFIDELGKFVTSDNNYFYKPTAAIIYIFFIVFYVITRALQGRRSRSRQEYLVNAVELAKDAAIGELDEHERRLALRLLEKANPTDPSVAPLRTLFETARIRPERKAPLAQRLLTGAKQRYMKVCGNRWFIRAVTAVFCLWGFVTILEIVGLIFTVEPHLRRQQTIKIHTPLTSRSGDYGFVEWANIVGAFVVGALVIWGIARLRRSRLAAYTMWDHAILVDIFFVQVFAFIQSQFGAGLGFVVDIVLLVSIRFMAASERERIAEEDGAREQEHGLAPAVPA